MDRLISEQAVIKILILLFIDSDKFKTAINSIKAIPSAESKTGHWKNNKCDVCGASRPPLFDNFCPNCGAKMVEPQEERDKE